MSEPLPNDAVVALHGRWKMIHAEFAGEAAPELVARRTELQLDAGGYRVWFDGHIVDAGEIKVDHAAHRLSMLGREGPNAGREIPFIFQLVGDRLRVCYGFDDAEPTDFTTRAGQSRYLAKYARVQ